MSVVALVPLPGPANGWVLGIPRRSSSVAGRSCWCTRLIGCSRPGSIGSSWPSVRRTQLARQLLGEVRRLVVAGGADRIASVAAALTAVGDDADIVLVHDAARAFVPVA